MKYSLANRFYYLTPVFSSIFCLLSNTVIAQIVPDNTLPNNTAVTSNGNAIEIKSGTTAGNNLFHSFSEFSLPTGNTASFDNAANIENVIGRVTGGSISNIDGLLKANGEANLFLINPAGIIFGKNAALDIGGSFIASTAESINFADNSNFSTVVPQTPPLLTVDIPVGLQLGRDAANIVVEGSGNNLVIDPFTFDVERKDRSIGLAVSPDKTLGLIGGGIDLIGGNITASGGKIELGSVGNGKVKLTADNSGWSIDYSAVNSFKDINLYGQASIDTSGNRGGDININTNFLGVYDGSSIAADTLGDAPAGNINILAREALEVIGFASDKFFVSRLSSNVTLEATGNGGNINIDTNYLALVDGGQINVVTFGLGDGGNITVNGGDIEVIGGYLDIREAEGELPLSSGLFAQADFGQTGHGGNLDIQADYLLVAGGGLIDTTSFGEGDGGNLIIDAGVVELIAGAAGVGASGLFSNTESNGQGGNINLKTDFLAIAAGAQIGAGAFAQDGDAGNIEIFANEIEIDGTSPNGGGSGIFSVVNLDSTGNGGNLTIDTKNLVVSNGGQIATSTAGMGDAGTLMIDAENIELVGLGPRGSSGLFSSAIIDSGNGGNIKIAGDRISIADGATISVSNFQNRGQTDPGQGKAGNIFIDANSLELDNSIAEVPSSITASTNNRGGGDINLNLAGDLTLNNNSEIVANTKGEGDSGNIAIFANNLALNQQAHISVDSRGMGKAGNIDLITNNLGANRGRITATAQQSGGGDINLTADLINLQNNTEISTSVANGTGGGGNITIDSRYIIGRNNSDIRANAVEGDGGNINITTDVILLALGSEVDASSQFGLGGEVEIKTPDTNRQLSIIELPQKIVNPTALIAAVCPVKNQETLVTTGKGGLAANPRQNLRGESVWEDLRNMTDVAKSSANESILEAKAWNINHRGKVELLSYIPQVSQDDYWTSFHQCQ